MAIFTGASRTENPLHRLPAVISRPELRREVLIALAGLALTVALAYLAVAASRPSLALAVFAALVIGLTVLVRPLIGLYLLVLSVPVQDIGVVSTGSLNLTATKVIFVVALGAWLLRRLASRDEGGIHAPLLAPFAFLLFMMAISVLAARSLTLSGAELFRWAEAALVYVMASDILRTRRQALLMVAVILVGPALEAVIGLRQFATGAGPESFAINESLSRAYGTFGMPNSYAGYLGMGLALALALGAYFTVGLGSGLVNGSWPSESVAPQGNSTAGKLFRTVLLSGATSMTAFLILAAMLVSLSRGAWLGLLAALAAMTLAARREALAPVAAIAAILAMLMISGHGDILPRILTDRIASTTSEIRVFDVRGVMVTPQNFAVVERMAQWQTGSSMFLQNPLLGIGIGNYNAAYADYRMFPWVDSPGHAHNYYVQIAAETGIGGLLAYLILIVAIFRQAARAIKRTSNPMLHVVAIGLLGIMAAVATHNLFENLHVLSMGVHLGAVLGLITALPRIGGLEGEVPSRTAGGSLA